MRKLMLCSTFLLVAAGTSPVVAQDAATSRASCDAKYFDYLVGRSVEEAQSIQGSDYRVLPMGAARGQAKPRRMTITINPDSRRIVSVDCG